ncbi:MAG: HAD family phosphatase [Flavobacterium sp.]|nr:HAD family phosphatase [Candidatus Neoflavobacterium equi]
MEDVLKQVKCVIFDLDGVIVNSLDFWKKTENNLLLKLGIIGDITDFKSTASMSTKDAIAYWCKKKSIKMEDVQEMERCVIDEMIRLIQSTECINKEIKLCINKLKADDYLLGLATNSPREIVNVVLEKARLQNIFDVVVTADDVEKVKPNPEIYLKTSRLLHLNPMECLVIEDSDFGILAAKRAGMYVLKYTYIN